MPEMRRVLCQVLKWGVMFLLFVKLCLNVGPTAQKSLLLVGGAISVAVNATDDDPTPKKREKKKKRWSLSRLDRQLKHKLSYATRTAIKDAMCCAMIGALACITFQYLPILYQQLFLVATPVGSVLLLEDEDEAERRTKKKRKRKSRQRWKKPRFKSYSQLRRWRAWKKKHNAERRAAYRVTHKEYLHAKKKYKQSMKEHEAEMKREFERRKSAQKLATECELAVRRKHGRKEMKSWETESWGTCPDVEEESKTETPPSAPPEVEVVESVDTRVETVEPAVTVKPPPPAPPNIEPEPVEQVAVEVERIKTAETVEVTEDVEPPPPAPPNIEPPTAVESTAVEVEPVEVESVEVAEDVEPSPPPAPPDDVKIKSADIFTKVEEAIQSESFDSTEGRYQGPEGASRKAIENYCKFRGTTDSFLSYTRLQKKMISRRYQDAAEDTVHSLKDAQHRLQLFKMVLEARRTKGKELTRDELLKLCPLVWDTGASFGLTPFREDFIDYVECNIKVNDIKEENTVIGIGTTLHKFTLTCGSPIWLPCLSYHLPTAKIRLFSPQTYHTLYHGHSQVTGNRVTMHVDNHVIDIPIERDGANVPIVENTYVSPEEKAEIGPKVKSALPQVDRKIDFFSGFGLSMFTDCNMAVEDLDEDLFYFVPNVVSSGNINLTKGQKHLLRWQHRLGISGRRVQELMRPSHFEEANGRKTTLPSVLPAKDGSSSCSLPRNETAVLANMKRRTPKIKRETALKESEGALSREKLEVGESVAMDQYVMSHPGRLPTGYGRESRDSSLHGGTIFHDAASKAIYVSNQSRLTAPETILSKNRFEQWLWDLAHAKVQEYRSDNGVFSAAEFTAACEEDGQKQSFSGVSAQHQNAEAERAIQTIVYMARYYMVHAALHWGVDGSDDLNLWPFAIDHACTVYNLLPHRSTGLTPMEFLTTVRSDHKDIRRLHVWGCPTFVLDAKLAEDKKIPKFKMRSRMGQYLGTSRSHSSQVALVRNLHTGYVSPQWHVLFDDDFETVYSGGSSSPELETIVNGLFETSLETYVEEEYDDGELVYRPPPLDEVWLSEGERRERRKSLNDQRERRKAREEARAAESARRLRLLVPEDIRPHRDPVETTPIVYDSDSDDDSVADDSSPVPVLESEGDLWADHPSVTAGPSTPGAPTPALVEDDSPAQTNQPARRRRSQVEQLNADEYKGSRDGNLGRNRSGRSKRITAAALARAPTKVQSALRAKIKYKQSMRSRREIGDNMLSFAKTEYRSGRDTVTVDDVDVPSVDYIMNCPLSRFIHFAANECGYAGTREDLVVNWVHPFFLKAKSEASKGDNPSWKQAMNGPFKKEYWEAAVKEVETLEGMDAWEVVDKTDDMNVLQGTWAFKCKRFPDGLIKKFKARFCARGDQQLEGVDFFETYAPVVQWTTVRLMLILEVLLKLKSKQGDVTAAFLHADLNENEKAYVEMPLGFRKPDKVLKLKKTLYGLRQSPHMFWKYLTNAMRACGMEVSKIDPCLFVGDKVIAICYVDDILFWSTDEGHINDLAVKLREQGLLLEQEDDAAGFLGVNLEKTEAGLIEMKQTGLIDRVIIATGLDTKMATPKWTPCENKNPLVRDEDGDLATGEFSYASVVGMLLYLAGHTRPDIAYAVNCCARYMFNPRKSHETAVKRIARYLKATRGKGLIFKPSSELRIDCYPDADFAGLYGHEKSNDPICAKSRTGFVIKVANCPILWQSKLQTETALSTMEAEIIALAHSCRELFPVMDLVHEMGSVVGLPTEDLTTMHVSIHEDNAGALVLAETIPPDFTPRSKYYAIKTVWFREEIQKRKIKLLKIETVEQLGDMFTKGLPRATFEYLRRKMMGW